MTMMNFRRPFVLLPAVSVLALAGCQPRESAAESAAPASAPAPAAMTASVANLPALPVLGPAPDWTLNDLDGKSVSSADFKGKIVVVDFWATWCSPCREEIPGYIELQNKYGADGLVIIGVSLDRGGPAKVIDFAKKFGINYPLVMGDGAVVDAFGDISAIPTTFLIDRDGNIRDRKVGAEETSVYEQRIRAVLQ
jgi:thiol-disulfide isomerase/thioredoxin